MGNFKDDFSEETRIILTEMDEIKKLLIKAEKPFLSLEEAAEYLGISKNTLYSYTHKNLITFFKVQHRKIYFRVEDLEDFVLNKKNRVKSTDEIEKEAITKIVAK